VTLFLYTRRRRLCRRALVVIGDRKIRVSAISSHTIYQTNIRKVKCFHQILVTLGLGEDLNWLKFSLRTSHPFPQCKFVDSIYSIRLKKCGLRLIWYHPLCSIVQCFLQFCILTHNLKLLYCMMLYSLACFPNYSFSQFGFCVVLVLAHTPLCCLECKNFSYFLCITTNPYVVDFESDMEK